MMSDLPIKLVCILLQIRNDLSKVISIINQLITQAPNIIAPFDINEFPRIAQDVMNGIDWGNAEIYLQMTGK